MKQINEHSITISKAYINIDEALEVGDHVTMIVEADVTESRDRDNFDGTLHRIYIVKGLTADVKYKGKVISSEESTEL